MHSTQELQKNNYAYRIFMRTVGMMLILAGLALIGALGIDVMSNDNTGIAHIDKSQIALIEWFCVIGTVLIIMGVSAAILDKKEEK